MFFNRFPKKLYNFEFYSKPTVLITDLLARVRFKSEVLNNVSAFYKYQLQDGETPEIVASRVYEDPEYHWVIILVNNLKDPQFDFPLDANSLELTIIKKYGYTGNTHGEKIAQAYSDIHHYELITTKTVADVGGLTTVQNTKSIVTLQQYSYASNTLVLNSASPGVERVYPDNASNTIYFKANNSGQNTASSSNATTTFTMTERYRPVYVYDYEFAENEKKRQIQILKKEYIPALSNELSRLLQ